MTTTGLEQTALSNAPLALGLDGRGETLCKRADHVQVNIPIVRTVRRPGRRLR